MSRRKREISFIRLRVGENIPTEVEKVFEKITAERRVREQGFESVSSSGGQRPGLVQAQQRETAQEYKEVFFGTSVIGRDRRDIKVKLMYLSSPLSIKAAPITPKREIASVKYINEPEHKKGFLIRRQKWMSEGRQEVLKPNFNDLYGVPWVTTNGKSELNAIKDIFRRKIGEITKHLGLEISFG